MPFTGRATGRSPGCPSRDGRPVESRPHPALSRRERGLGGFSFEAVSDIAQAMLPRSAICDSTLGSHQPINVCCWLELRPELLAD